MIAEINQILSDFKQTPDRSGSAHRLKLGDSFLNNLIIKRILQLVDATSYKESPKTRQKEAGIRNEPLVPLTRHIGFRLFVVILNKYFDASKNRVLDGFEERLRAISLHLNVAPADYKSLVDFHQADKPYGDTAQCLYLAPENSNQLIRSKGVNVHFINPAADEIIYFKYFKGYNLFLSKKYKNTRSPNSITEEIALGEINLITERNYSKIHASLPTFKQLKDLIGNFHPLQLIDVRETPYNPQILLDPENCNVSISGSSCPISNTIFFEPVLAWLGIFNTYKTEPLKVSLNFKYFNTYTAKFLIHLVWACNRMSEAGKTVDFYWYYDTEDDEMKEFGEHLRSQSVEKGKFHILETKNLI